MSEHISSQFENDILQINVNLTKMGGICEDNLKKAIKAIIIPIFFIFLLCYELQVMIF